MTEKSKTIRNYWITEGSSIEKEFVLRRLDCELGFSKINPDYLIHKSFSLYRKAKWIRQASTKTKAEVSGGGKKPWPQKGRGRARVGSIRSPLWRGGGVSFGPKPTKQNLKLNNREYDQAVRLVLIEKQKSIIPISLLQTLNVAGIDLKKQSLIGKTKIAKQLISNILEKYNISSTSVIGKKTITIVVSREEYNLLKNSLFLQSIQNIPKIKLINDNHLSINDLIRSNYLLLTAMSSHNLTQKDFCWKKIQR
jgi:large subunit ribosomal protein L4